LFFNAFTRSGEFQGINGYIESFNGKLRGAVQPGDIHDVNRSEDID
jgi:hypothetical protein